MTRRTIIGGGVVAAGGAAAVAAGQGSRGRRWLHSVGLVDGPDARPPPIAVHVEHHTLSPAPGGPAAGWGIATPGDPQALLLCLHGRGATHRYAFDGVAVHRFVAATGLPWAVVAVDGGPSSYWHRRGDGRDPQATIFDGLLPVLDRRIGSLPLLLLGWSMGGYGALLAATERPDRVAAVAASSPAVWRSFEEAAAGAFDDRADFERHDLFDRAPQLARLPVRIDCGYDDPFFAGARLLARRAGVTSTGFGDGFHDTATWRSFVPDQLEFLRRAL